MIANKNLFVSFRIDKETKDWMEKRPLNHSQLINYGLHLIRLMERNVTEAKVFITGFSIEPKQKETLPF